MLLIATACLTFSNQQTVPMILMLRPRSGADQWVSAESYDIVPRTSAIEYTDLYGNLCQRLTAPTGQFQISASATVHVADDCDRAPGLPVMPIEDLPDWTLHFLVASRYCESDKLSDLAIEITQGVSPGYDQVERIRSWIYGNVAYLPGSSNSSTSAMDTSELRQGVCRDMAHLGIALTRAIGIPARMVVGYLHNLEPMDLHAWFEAFIGNRWYTFDPKEKETWGGRIVIGYGRDAVDVAAATQFGSSQLTELKVGVERVE